MIAPVPNIQEQLATLASQLTDAISQASEQVTTINEHLKELGRVDPQALDHIDIFTNNTNKLSLNVALLEVLATNDEVDETKVIDILTKIAGWMNKDSHVLDDDSHLHAPAIDEQTIYAAHRFSFHAGLSPYA